MALTVVIPVYSGLEYVRRCIESVLHSDCKKPFQALIVYDCGPDPQVEQYVEKCASIASVVLLKNTENLGFVKSVNRAIAHCDPNDVVLLNSDTIVPTGWLDRMLAVADQDSAIGTVTPMSNNAEIFSFPLMCQNNEVSSLYTVQDLDRSLSEVNPATAIDVPTGVGFCMFVRRAAIVAVGLFDDKTFGRGYGEENDFCQRIAIKGFRNVGCPNIFVHHEGGISFGEEKLRLIAQHNEIIGTRYPKYFHEVSNFIREDPLLPYRLNGVLQLLSNCKIPTVLAICHGMGGGTTKNMVELASHFEGQINFVYLEPIDANQVAIQLPKKLWPPLIEVNCTDSLNLLLDLLKCISPQLVHVHHIKGLENIVLRVIADLNCDYIITLHDYYLISSNPTLTDTEGRFNIERLHDESIVKADLNRGAGFSLSVWGELTEELLDGAKLVIAPNVCVKDVYNLRFPTLDIVVTEHLDAENCGAYPSVKVQPNVNQMTRILVIGALGKEKGADLLESVAIMAHKAGLALQFELLGYAYRRLHNCVKVYGAYEDDQLQVSIAKLNPSFVWYPCLWPETYSYTLSAVLELGLPLIVPRLGALYIRTLSRPFTRHVEEIGDDAEQWLNELMAFSAELNTKANVESLWRGQKERSKFYREQYPKLIGDRRFSNQKILPSIDFCHQLLSHQPRNSVRLGEKVVHILVIVRDMPVLRRMTSLVPIHIQRRIKRLFVRKPLHEMQSASKTKTF